MGPQGKSENPTSCYLLLSLSQSLWLGKRSFSWNYCFLDSADGNRQRRSLANSKEIQDLSKSWLDGPVGVGQDLLEREEH